MGQMNRRQKEYGVVFFFCLSFLDGWDGHVDTWATPGKDTSGTVNLADPSVPFMLLLFFLFLFLLNSYIEAGLVYRRLALQIGQSGKSWTKRTNGVRMSLPPSPPLFCLIFPPSPLLWWRAAYTWEFEKLKWRSFARRLVGCSAG